MILDLHRQGVSALVERQLDRTLFEAITRQLAAKGIAVRTGTLVDATLIASASIRCDGEARWAGHRRRKPVHGYKAHVAMDEAAGLILGVEVTSANVHDAAELDAVLPDDPGDVYGDSAFNGDRASEVITARGGRGRIVQTGTWSGAAALARLHKHNAQVRRVRARIEKVFGTCKRSYGLRRMRCIAREGRGAGEDDSDRLQSAAQLATAVAVFDVTRPESARSGIFVTWPVEKTIGFGRKSALSAKPVPNHALSAIAHRSH